MTALAARTEGWAAGLQLAGLSLREQADVAGFVASFSGSHRYVLDYPGEDLVAQSAPGGRLFVLFDGMLGVLRDGRKVTEVGPGAVLGELALLDGGRRTATLRAVTPCRVAVVPGDRVAPDRLDQLARQHDQPTT